MLNVVLWDAPAINRVQGRVGDVAFGWEFEEMLSVFPETTHAALEQRIMDTLQRLALVNGRSNLRLNAALHYFHVASRLVAVGESPWEFTAEIILNLTKVLQILFGNEDAIRAGLRQLGYPDEEVESDFIPILRLRNSFDVAHESLSLGSHEQLQVLYEYLSLVDVAFRRLLDRALEAVKAGTLVLREEPNTALRPDNQRTLARLVDTLQATAEQRLHRASLGGIAVRSRINPREEG